MVASYTYLGMPFTMDAKGGPDVLAHTVRRNAQAETILAALSQHIACASWPEMAKLSIYKTFIRPIIEYAAPLILPTMQLAKMVSHPKRKRKRKKKRPHREADSRDVPPRCPPNPITMLTMLENTQKRALSWIFGRKIPHAVLLSLAGLSPISLRLEELSTRFLGHLSRMHSGNPLSSHVTTTSLSCSPLLNGVLNHRHDVPNLAPSIIKNHYIEKRLCLLSKLSTLTRYILPECRIPHGGPDQCLRICSPSIRRLAIRWRCNTLGTFATCMVCNLPFSRAHLTRCDLVPMSMLAGSLNASFLQSYLQASQSANNDEAHHYTILDHLLNMGHYHPFDMAVKRLSPKLLRNQHPTI